MTPRTDAGVTILARLLACWFVAALPGVRAVAAPPAPTELPGIWREFEAGDGPIRVQDMRQASGGRLIGWFEPARPVRLSFDLPQAMPNARLYVRYNNAMTSVGQVELTLLGDEPRVVGTIAQTRDPRWDRFRWGSIAIGDLPAGTHVVQLECPPGRASGGLDVAVLLEDRWDGLYQPPEQFEHGRAVGVGQVLPPVSGSVTIDAPRGEVQPGKPLTFQARLQHRQTRKTDHPLTWSIETQTGQIVERGQVQVDLQPGENSELAIVAPRGVGAFDWYVMRLSLGGESIADCHFVALPEITRPLPDEQMRSAMLIDGRQHWLGLNLGYGTPGSVISDFHELGLHTIRTGGNKANPAEHEADVRQLTEAGLRIHWVLNYRGHGINPAGTGVREIAALDINGPVMKQWFDNYKARCKAFFEHFSKPGEERLRFYIVGNEPDKRDAHTGLAGRPDIAVRLTRAMAEAANEVNPRGIFVQSPSIAQPDADYLRQMIVEHRLADHCDIIGTHTYGSQTLDTRMDKPWRWLREAGSKRLVACTESGVSTGWTPKGYDPRQWQTDYMALFYVKARRFGHATAILFTHDDDHKPDWAKLRVKGEKLQPNWTLVQEVLTRPRTLSNGGFEAPNDPLSMWTPEVSIDQVGWMGSFFDWHHTEQPHEGESCLRITAPGDQMPLPAYTKQPEQAATEPARVYQVITEGIVPGRAVTVSAFARSTGATASLSVHGYDPLDGLAEQRASTGEGQWRRLEVTVTPANPWIVIALSVDRSASGEQYAWFDSVAVSASH